MAIEPGTLMHKAIPPRMVEPYLTGRRSIIAGFVHRVADSSYTDPGEYYSAMSLGYEGSEFTPDMDELYLLRRAGRELVHETAVYRYWLRGQPGPPGAGVLH